MNADSRNRVSWFFQSCLGSWNPVLVSDLVKKTVGVQLQRPRGEKKKGNKGWKGRNKKRRRGVGGVEKKREPGVKALLPFRASRARRDGAPHSARRSKLCDA